MPFWGLNFEKEPTSRKSITISTTSPFPFHRVTKVNQIYLCRNLHHFQILHCYFFFRKCSGNADLCTRHMLQNRSVHFSDTNRSLCHMDSLMGSCSYIGPHSAAKLEQDQHQFQQVQTRICLSSNPIRLLAMHGYRGTSIDRLGDAHAVHGDIQLVKLEVVSLAADVKM